MTGRPVPDEGFQWTKYSLGEMKRKIEKNTFLSVCLHNSLAHVTHADAYAHQREKGEGRERGGRGKRGRGREGSRE